MPKNRALRAIDLRPSSGGSAAVVLSGGGGTTTPTTDHGALTGLLDDDHTQYHNDARGDARYALIGRTLTAGDGLTGGGTLAADRTFAVGAGAGITVSAGAVALTTPGTLAAASTNSASGNHTHAITASYNVSGVAAETLLKSNAAGGLTVNQLVASGTGAKVRTPLIDTASGALTLDAAGDQILVGASNRLQSAHYTSAATGWGIDYGGAADFRFIQADELQVKIFTAVIEQAQAGRFMVAKSVAQLAYDFTAPAAGSSTYFYVKDLPGAPDMAVFESDAVIANSDYVSLHTFSRANGGLTITSCYGRVQLVAGDTGPGGVESGVQQWYFSRSAGAIGAGNPPGAMAAGTVVSADGSLVIDWGRSGDGYVETSAVDGPYNARNSPYLQVVTWTGDPNTGKAARARLGNLKGITGAAEYGFWTGDITKGNLLATGDKVALRQGTNDRIVLDSAGDSYFAGVMTIGTSGEIRQGTGTAAFTPGAGNFVGLRIWRDGNVGRIGGYGTGGGYTGGVAQWWAGTDGKLYAGGGKVKLGSDGIELQTSLVGPWARESALSFYNDTTKEGELQFSNTASSGRQWRLGWVDDGLGYIQAVSSAVTQYLYLYGGNDASIAVGGIPGGSSQAHLTADEVGLIAPLTTVTGTMTLSAATPLLTVGGAAVTTGDARIEVGTGRAGDGNAYVDLVATNDTYTDYSARLIRYGGKNGGTTFVHRGTGDMVFYAQEAAQFRIATAGTNRIIALATGEVGIGKSPVSGRALDVNGDLVASGVVLGALRAVPGTAPASVTDAAGTVGDIRWDTSYIYIKVADTGNRWRRAQLFTW
jgi:hypothetical protein